MRLADPDALDLPYTRRMMAFLLFNARPRSVLMLGLGGGSLAKFCYRHLPWAEITAVEIDHDVIAFRDEFRIPPDDERFAVVHADGAEYVGRGTVRADVVLADAFDTEGVAPALAQPDFIGRLHGCLCRDGILAMNIAGGRSSYAGLLDGIQAAFGGPLLTMPSRDDGNAVVLAFKNKEFVPHWKRAKTAARELQNRFGLEFTRFVQQLECGERRSFGVKREHVLPNCK